MSSDLLTKLEESYSNFSKGQKAIADYILNHYDKAAFMTAAKLGSTVGVSESTVVRFVVELGYEGYPDLKKVLQQLIKNKLTVVQRVHVTEDRIQENGVLHSVLNSDIANITETLGRIDENEFNKAIEAIVNAKKIYIIGARSSSTLAYFLSFNLNLIFDNIRLIEVNGASEVFEQMIRIGKDDVIIGISFPRYSQRTVKALSFAKNRGATVIAITDSKSSPVALEATNLLISKSDMASFVDSLVAPMSLINALIVGVTMRKKNEIEEIFTELEQIYDEYQVYDKTHTGIKESSEKDDK